MKLPGKELKIHLSERDFKSYKTPEYIIDNFNSLESYKNKLEELNDVCNFQVEINQEFKLPHYRYFEFKSKKNTFTLRIDAGLAHGVSPVKYLTSQDLTNKNDAFEIRKYVHHDLIYNINIED